LHFPVCVSSFPETVKRRRASNILDLHIRFAGIARTSVCEISAFADCTTLSTVASSTSVEARGLFPNPQGPEYYNTPDRFFSRMLYANGVELLYFASINERARFGDVGEHQQTTPAQIPLAPGTYELHLYFSYTGHDFDSGGGENAGTFSLDFNGERIIPALDVESDAMGQNIADERVFKYIKGKMRTLILSTAVAALCAPIWAADEAVNSDEIVRKFAAKETEFAEARNNYTYRQSLKMEELDPSGNPTGGKWRRWTTSSSRPKASGTR